MSMAKISLFKGRKIRKVFHNKEWWFSVVDVVSALTDSNDPKQYFYRMMQRNLELAKGGVQIVLPLDFPTEGGMQKVNCATTEGIFRIIQSIPSPKAEPFKRWLARVGLEKKIGRSVVSKKNYLGLSQKKLAFSLIELIVVIAILAIVVVIAMGDYGFAAKQARLQVASEELIAALEEARVNSQTSAGGVPRCWGVEVSDDQATFFGWEFNVDTQSCVFDAVVVERAVSVDAQIQVDEIRKVEEGGESSSLGSVTLVFEPPSGVLAVYASLSEEPLGGFQQVEIDLSYDGSANEALQRTVKVVPATATFDML